MPACAPQASTDTEPWPSCGTSSLLRDHCIGCILSNHFRSFGGKDQVKTTLNKLFRTQSFHEGPVTSGTGQGTSSRISGCIGWDPGSGSHSPKALRAPGTPLSSLHVCSLAHHGGPAGRGGPPVIPGKTLSPRPGERARRENISAKRITSWIVAESKCLAKGGFLHDWVPVNLPPHGRLRVRQQGVPAEGKRRISLLPRPWAFRLGAGLRLWKIHVSKPPGSSLPES